MTSSRSNLPSDVDFEATLGCSDLPPLVLRAHQAIEAALNATIAQTLPAPHAVEVERLSTALKIDLAIGLSTVQSDDALAFRKINALRNALAHDPQAAFVSDDAKDLFNVLSDRQRRLVGRGYSDFPNHIEILRQVLRVLFVDMVATLERLREARLRDEVLHDMIQDRMRRSRPIDERFVDGIDREIRERIHTKKLRRSPDER